MYHAWVDITTKIINWPYECLANIQLYGYAEQSVILICSVFHIFFFLLGKDLVIQWMKWCQLLLFNYVLLTPVLELWDIVIYVDFKIDDIEFFLAIILTFSEKIE